MQQRTEGEAKKLLMSGTMTAAIREVFREMEGAEEEEHEEKKGVRGARGREGNQEKQEKKFLSPILVKSFDFPREELKEAAKSEEEEDDCIAEEEETDEGERTKPLLVNKAKVALKDLKGIELNEQKARQPVLQPRSNRTARRFHAEALTERQLPATAEISASPLSSLRRIEHIINENLRVHKSARKPKVESPLHLSPATLRPSSPREESKTSPRRN